MTLTSYDDVGATFGHAAAAAHRVGNSSGWPSIDEYRRASRRYDAAVGRVDRAAMGGVAVPYPARAASVDDDIAAGGDERSAGTGVMPGVVVV